jgi:adenosylhomocysteine nucleosidase/5'-methylthioadenosine nucleosidase
VRTIGVVMAMRAEAQPVLDALGATPVDSPPGTERLPQQWHVAHRNGVDVVIALNGVDPHFGVDSIATQPAVLSAFTTCCHWPVDLLVSAGAAGGWARHGTAVGDVYVSRDRFVYHDRRIDLPGFREYGHGRFAAVDVSRLAHELGLKQGIVTTSNSLDENDDDRRLIAASGACVKDMEAAAVADVGRLLGVPVMAVKAITDLVDSHVAPGDQLLANLELSIAHLCDVLLRVIDWCADHEVADLGGFEG